MAKKKVARKRLFTEPAKMKGGTPEEVRRLQKEVTHLSAERERWQRIAFRLIGVLERCAASVEMAGVEATTEARRASLAKFLECIGEKKRPGQPGEVPF